MTKTNNQIFTLSIQSSKLWELSRANNEYYSLINHIIGIRHMPRTVLCTDSL